MRKEYRLISDFKKQTQTTIWKHLDAMAVNYAVYSSHLKGFPPYLTDFDVYLFCDTSCMVVVCLDSCGHGEEQTYVESETLSPLILSEGQKPRVSKVWKLAQTVSVIKNQLTIPVYGVLLTEADILNAYDLYDMWESNSVMVIDTLRRIKYHGIPVNEDRELSCKAYVDTLTETSLSVVETDKCEETSREGQSEEDFGFDAADNDEESDFEDTDEDDTTPYEDALFPNGEIEQHPNLSVKVEIIRPIPNPREELDRLVGCNDIKRRMDDELVNLTSYNKMLQQYCPSVKQHAVSLHSLFLGRPGTRARLWEPFGGDEERSARQIIDMAKGGVLMIDETYLLNCSQSHPRTSCPLRFPVQKPK